MLLEIVIFNVSVEHVMLSSINLRSVWHCSAASIALSKRLPSRLQRSMSFTPPIFLSTLQITSISLDLAIFNLAFNMEFTNTFPTLIKILFVIFRQSL